MKRIFSILLASTLSLSLVACGNKPEEPSNNVYEFAKCKLIIIDNEDFFSQEEEKQMVDILSPMCEQSDCDLVIAATNRRGDGAGNYLPNTEKNWIAVDYNSATHMYSVYADGSKCRKLFSDARVKAIINAADAQIESGEAFDALLNMSTQALMTYVQFENKPSM